MAWARDGVHPKRVEGERVWESPRRLNVRDEVDVLVCGGGPAGIGAALAGARSGARTLLVERFGMLGGMWTAGLLNPFFEGVGRGWVCDDLVARLAAAGAWQAWRFAHVFDVETMKRTLEAMATEDGVELLYHTWIADAIVEGGIVRGAVVESKAGRQAILAKVVIDATGDGDVAARAGCAYEFGREGDGLVQPMTLMFTVRGKGDFEQDHAPALYDLLLTAIEQHGLGLTLPIGRCNYAPWMISTPQAGTAAVQATHVYRLNPLDPGDLTRGTVDARRQAAELMTAFRKVPGLEGVELAETAATLGIRETRRVRGRGRLEADDLARGRRCRDAVTACAFGIDIHDPSAPSDETASQGLRSQPYEIPYRCLVPRDVDGLLLSGRCISGSHEAHASYRVTGTCLGTGQAAGLAAAWSVARGVPPAAIDGPELRAALAERGVQFLPPAE